MTKNYEFTGRTTEEAINAGLAELNRDITEVTIVSMIEGSKGLFGLFGSRPAKVVMQVNEEETESKENIFAHMLDEPAAPASEPKGRRASEKKPSAPKEEKAVKAETASVKEEKASSESTGDTAKKEQKKPARKPRGEAKPVAEAKKEEKEEAPAAEEKPLEPAEIKDPESKEGIAQQFLMNVTRQMGVEVQVYASTDEENNVRINMMGDSKGILIGRRGETLDALQYLTSLKVNKGQSEYTRVTLDTENYRAKREEALTRLANRMANRCQKTGRRVSLEPMNPYERRIMHAALQNHTAVTTHSEGEEPNRHVVITLK